MENIPTVPVNISPEELQWVDVLPLVISVPMVTVVMIDHMVLDAVRPISDQIFFPVAGLLLHMV